MFEYTLDEMLELKKAMNRYVIFRPKWFMQNTGICENLHQLQCQVTRPTLGTVLHRYRALTKYYETWKYFSGDLIYPIPSQTQESAEYCYHQNVYDLYDNQKSYCMLRYALVDHIIEQMKAQ